VIPIRDAIPHRHTPVVTWSIIAINTLVFLFQLTIEPRDLQELIYLFGLVPARYSHPAWAQAIGGSIAGLTSSDVGGIAWWAHVGGFAAGAILHRLFLSPVRRLEPDEYGLERAWANRS
jgi:membrane associated rhomboid family serine protease